ncbi:protein ADM2a [Rhinichthys klamathensis goyatoka]|uniref:protein ADM2a n=1 Tax=Rhinichthys klamathensis goyatoka TaxID=3034132 RepID=UPI0024B563DE|nr:protein ADM2a [Rhinichthys klamathensis goyatoka]
MGALFPVFVYCISLLSSQLLALPVRNRLDFMTRLHQLREEDPISPDVTERPNTDHGVSIDRTVLWRAILSRPPPPDPTGNPLHVGQQKAGESSQTGESPRQRDRRNVHSRGHHNHHHGQLMRVGCVLGTCQVQNLSHRLYQLAGQSRREDSPINPSNPRSYG